MSPLETRAYCLHICKWYPDPNHQDFANFISHQVSAASSSIPAVVFYIRKADKNFIFKESSTNKTEYLIGFKGYKSPIINALIRYLLSRHHLKKIIKAHGKPSILHAHVHTRPFIWAHRLAKRFQVPYIISEHWSGYCNGEFYVLPKWKQKSILKYLNKAKTVIAVSDFLKRNLQEIGVRSKIKVIPNIVNLNGIRRKANLGSFRFLFIGDFRDKVKNISGIIAAFNQIQEDCELHLLGDGIDMALIKEKVLSSPKAEKIKLSGLKPHKETLHELSLADCLIVNSRTETFSIVAAESLAMGIPLICTKCGGPEDFLNDEIARLIPVNDDQALYEAMIQVLQSAENLAANNQAEIFQEKFSFAKIGEQLSKVYEECT